MHPLKVGGKLGKGRGKVRFLRQHPPEKILETSPENRHISCIEDKHGWKDMLRFRETYKFDLSHVFSDDFSQRLPFLQMCQTNSFFDGNWNGFQKKSAAYCRVCYMLRPFKARFDKHQPFLVMSKGDISQAFSDDQLEGKIVVSSQALTRGDIHHSYKIRTCTPKL